MDVNTLLHAQWQWQRQTNNYTVLCLLCVPGQASILFWQRLSLPIHTHTHMHTYCDGRQFNFATHWMAGRSLFALCLKPHLKDRTMDKNRPDDCLMGIFEFFHVIWLTQRILYIFFCAFFYAVLTEWTKVREIDYYAFPPWCQTAEHTAK